MMAKRILRDRSQRDAPTHAGQALPALMASMVPTECKPVREQGLIEYLEGIEARKKWREDVLDALDAITTAVEWEVPPIRDGVDVERRCAILAEHAAGVRRLLAQRDGNPRGGDGTAPSRSDDSPVPEGDAPKPHPDTQGE